MRFSALTLTAVKMKKARFTETQTINILKFADSGMKAEEICCQNGSHNVAFYNEKATLGAMDLLNILMVHFAGHFK